MTSQFVLPLECLNVESMASGHRSLRLTTEITREAFADYATSLVATLGGVVVARADTVVERVWEVTIRGQAFWIAFDDYALGVSLDAKDDAADNLISTIRESLLALRLHRAESVPLTELTQREWRKLGFFYDRNDATEEWRIVGSTEGLLRLAALLRRYASDPRNEMISQHEHYGPYADLEVMTWSEAGIDAHSIHGPLTELARLADIVEQEAQGLEVGRSARVREKYSTSARYSLVLELRPDSFDPASLDADLASGAG